MGWGDEMKIENWELKKELGTNSSVGGYREVSMRLAIGLKSPLRLEFLGIFNAFG
jgi:hypothetical protein